tara:strand:- start:736 stop:1923 length:1188 start_codon:yes stop_codon:yes gene_type:complete
VGRFLGLYINKGTAGGGGSGVKMSEYNRSTGLGTDAETNNITTATFGDTTYSNVGYNTVGLITGFTETIGSDEKEWLLTYDDRHLCTIIEDKADAPTATVVSGIGSTSVDEGLSLLLDVDTTKVASGSTLYWDVKDSANIGLSTQFAVSERTGSFSLVGTAGTFAVKPENDGIVESSDSYFIANVYDDSTRFHKIGQSSQFLIKDGANSYDWSFATETHYGTSVSYRYSGDGTVPTMSLGDVQDWDMFYEIYVVSGEVGNNSNEWLICNDGYGSTGGWLLGHYDNNTTNEMSVATPSGGYAHYMNYRVPYDQWNWVKIEWRGGSRFQIWQKTSAGANYTNRGSTTSNVHSTTRWNYISFGQGKSSATGGGSSGLQQQSYAKIRNFGLNTTSTTNL